MPIRLIRNIIPTSSNFVTLQERPNESLALNLSQKYANRCLDESQTQEQAMEEIIRYCIVYPVDATLDPNID